MIVLLAIPAMAAAGGFPTGRYAATLTTPAPLKGAWVLSFQKNLSYTITDNGKVVVRGHYTSVSSLKVGRETGPLACAKPGVYTWKLGGKRLVFTRVSDPCQGRSAVLAHPFNAIG